MARNKVTTRYQKIRPRKKHRKHWADEILPHPGLSPLARYVEENMAEGLDPLELIQQFQEYDCEHEGMEELVVGTDHYIDRCTVCHILKRRARNR
jgi:hypothetical protein